MVTDHEFDPFVASIARELKEPVRLDAAFDQRVMAALEPEVISLASRRAPQPWYRRTFLVPAPLGGLAAAAALAGVVAIGALALQRSGQQTLALAPGEELVRVADRPVDPSTLLQSQQFIFADSSAYAVSLVGQFNDWQEGATPMVYDSAHAAWTVTVMLPPGRYEYQFLVNGERHVADPAAPIATSDFGSPNSVVTVRAPER